MDVQFEKVVDEFLEIEPLDFNKTEEFYNKYKSYLDNNFPSQINDFEEYRLIISNIGAAYLSVKKCDEAIPLFKKAIKLGDERDSTRQNLIISYFSKKKYLSAYYYYIKFKPKSEIKEFNDAMKVAKQAAVYNLFVWFLYSGIAFYVITMTYEFFYDDIEGVWDNVMRSIYSVAVIIFSLKYFLKGKVDK